MGGFSIGHWIVVLIILVLLFGRGRISDIMGDVAKGIKSFKRGMAEDEESSEESSQKVLHHQDKEALHSKQQDQNS